MTAALSGGGTNGIKMGEKMGYDTFFWYALTAAIMMSFGIYFAIKLALRDGVDRYIKKRDEKEKK